MVNNPILYFGVDIGYRRDTSAVSAVYHDHDRGVLCLFCHKVWAPGQGSGDNKNEVFIPEITEYILKILRLERVGGLWFDPHQWASEAQRIKREGYDRFLHEVTQSGSYMVEVATNLQILMQRGALLIYKDRTIRNQFSWCAAKATEAGPRIVKREQSKPVDFVIAFAMACWGASQQQSFISEPLLSEGEHVIALEAL